MVISGYISLISWSNGTNLSDTGIGKGGGKGTLKTTENAAGVKSVDRDVGFTVQVEFFLNTTYCADKCSFSCGILDCHGTVDCATTIVTMSNVGRSYREQMLMIHPS